MNAFTPRPTQFRNSYKGPNWLWRPNARRFIYSLLKPLDLLMEVALQGVAAAMPGFGTPTALAALGQSRGRVQGEAETDQAFAQVLVDWYDFFRNLGSDEVLAQEIQRYLGNNPTVRVVNRAGFFVTANPNGTISYATDPAWNWDRVSNPERNGVYPGQDPWWSDIWIIVYPSEFTTYANATDPAWVAAWGTYQGFGTGHEVSRAQYDEILAIVRQCHAPHTYVQAIIWCTDPALFVPGSLGTAGNPDGTWGNWSKNVNGVQVPARTTQTAGGTVRYWIPTNGG